MDTTVSKALKVLEMLVRAPGPMRLSAIATAQALTKSNAHRTLATLVQLGYVAQDLETGHYRPSLKLFELGAKVISDHPAKRAAAPYLQDLHRSTGETVNLCVLDHGSVLFIDKLLSPRPLRFTTQPGSRIQAPFSAAGLALLAYETDPRPMIEDAAKELVEGPKFDVEAVLSGLPAIRKLGYAETKDSWTPGIFSIASPILRHDGTAAAAIGVSGPTERLDATRRQALIEAVMSTSARIAEGVGRL